MGMSPDQVDACAVWKLKSAFEGWQKANSPKVSESPSVSIDDMAKMASDAGIEGM